MTGTGAPWLLYANGAGTTTITIAGTPYTVTAGSTVGTSAYTGSQSITVSVPPSNFLQSTMPSTALWSGITYGNGKFVVTALSGSSGAYYAFTSLPVAYGIYNGATVRA